MLPHRGFRFACRPQLELISFLPIAIIAYVIHQYNMQHPLIYKPKNEILNSTVRLCGGIYSNTVDIYYFI